MWKPNCDSTTSEICPGRSCSRASANERSSDESVVGSISPPWSAVPSCEYMRARFSNLACPLMMRARISTSRSRVRCFAAVFERGNFVIWA